MKTVKYLLAGLSALILPNLLRAQTITGNDPFPSGAMAFFCPNDFSFDVCINPGASTGEIVPVGQTASVVATTAGAYGGPTEPGGNSQGNGFARAVAPGPGVSLAFAGASIPYQVSAPGVFNLTFRISAAQTTLFLDVLSGAEIQVGPLEPDMRDTVDATGKIILVTGLAQPFNFGEAAGPFAEVDAGSATGQNGTVSFGTEKSNLMPLPVQEPDGTFEDTITFSSSSTRFWLTLSVLANGGVAFADPTITPNAVNPNIIVTPLAPLNPDPNAPLLTADEFAGLTLSEQQQLESIGISPPSATPEPSSLLLLGTGLVGLAGAMRRKRLA